MATKALITPQQYLATQFECEPELVHGELAARPLPNLIHGRTQQRLAVHLDSVGYCCRFGCGWPRTSTASQTWQGSREPDPLKRFRPPRLCWSSKSALRKIAW